MSEDIAFKHSQYKVYEKIGESVLSGSVVMRAREMTALEFVACKRIQVATEARKQEIAHEVKLLSSLQHPNIIRLVDQSAAPAQRFIYLFFELCQDYNLARICQTDGRLPLDSALIFGADMRDALLFLHSRGLLYNQLHPSGCLLTSNGILKLSKFGIACSFKQQPLQQETIAKHTARSGFVHRAPETLLPNGVYSIQSDLYSLGQNIYFMITGFWPYSFIKASGPQEFAQRLLQEEESALQRAMQMEGYTGPDLPKAVLELLFRLIQPLPFRRPSWEWLQKQACWRPCDEIPTRDEQQLAYHQFLKNFGKEIFGDKMDQVSVQFTGVKRSAQLQASQEAAQPAGKPQEANGADRTDQRRTNFGSLHMKVGGMSRGMEQVLKMLQEFTYIPYERIQLLPPPDVVQPKQVEMAKLIRQDETTMIQSLEAGLQQCTGQAAKVFEVAAEAASKSQSPAKLHHFISNLLCLYRNEFLAPRLYQQKSPGITSLLQLLPPLVKTSQEAFAALAELCLTVIYLCQQTPVQASPEGAPVTVSDGLWFKMLYGRDLGYYVEFLLVESKGKPSEWAGLCFRFATSFGHQMGVPTAPARIEGVSAVAVSQAVQCVYEQLQSAESLQSAGQRLGLQWVKQSLHEGLQALLVLLNPALKPDACQLKLQLVAAPLDDLVLQKTTLQCRAAFCFAEQFVYNGAGAGADTGADGRFQRREKPAGKQTDQATVSGKEFISSLLSKDNELNLHSCVYLGAFLATDPFVDAILKNPLNVKNHRLYRLARAEGGFLQIVDALLQKAAECEADDPLQTAAAFLIAQFQHVLETAAHSVRQYAITGAFLNLKYFGKCIACLELFDCVFGQQIYNKPLFFTAALVQDLEVTLFALGNTLYEMRPSPDNSYFQAAGEEFYQFTELLVRVVSRISTYAWHPAVFGALYYQSGQGKQKGLWFALMQLLKEPQGEEFRGSKDPRAREVLTLKQGLQSSVLQTFRCGFARLREGPCGDALYQSPWLYKAGEGQRYEVLQDVVQLGLLRGGTVAVEEARTGEKVVKESALRLTCSRSMFQGCLEAESAGDALSLLGQCIAMRPGYTVEQSGEFFQEVVKHCLQNAPKTRRAAWDCAEELLQAEHGVLLRGDFQELFETALEQQDACGFLRTLASLIKAGMEAKLAGTPHGMVSIINQQRPALVRNCAKMLPVVEECAANVLTFLEKPILAAQDTAIVALELIEAFAALFYRADKLIDFGFLAQLFQKWEPVANADRINAAFLSLAAQVPELLTKQVKKFDSFAGSTLQSMAEKVFRKDAATRIPPEWLRE